MTAWLNLLGLITVLGADQCRHLDLLSSGASRTDLARHRPARLPHQTIFLVLITGAQALINHLGIKLTAKLTDFSGYLIFASRSILIAVSA